MEKEEVCRPVPAPRRLYPEIRMTEYENVTIDLINKSLNINSENIHAITKDKLPNNKVFLGGTLSDEESTTVTNNNHINAIQKCILTETNNLYGYDENETVPDPPCSTSTPVPAPRKPQNNTPTHDMQHSSDIYENTPMRIAPTPIKNTSTGAISKESPNISNARRKAPELPPKTYLSAERIQRYSISSDISHGSSNFNNTTGSYDLNDKHFKNSEIPKSASSATLNSSTADSNASSEGSKFKSPSPG